MKHGKHSVRVKMILLTFAAIFGTVALCIVLNETLLVKYYENSKQKMLGEMYVQIDRLVSEEGGVDFSEAKEDTGDAGVKGSDGISDELRLKLDILCAKSNVTTVIVEDLIFNERPKAIVSYFFGTGGKNNQDEPVIRELIGDYFLPGYGEGVKEKKLEKETE